MKLTVIRRYMSSVRAIPRVKDFVDLCIIGAGPAGLTAAIKFKQLDKENKYRVVVLEKAGDLGSHTLSGMILEPRAMMELFPNFKQECLENKKENGVILDPVNGDEFKLLTANGSIPLPLTPGLTNKGKNYVGSLSTVVRWLGEKAEELGVELYTGVSVSDIIYNKNKDGVIGVATKDLGIDKNGKQKDSFERGLEFHSKQIVLAEGCHGSITKQILKKFNLRQGRGNQSYGLGLKEVWEVKPENFKKGMVAHTMGYPLSKDLYGGGFQYHFGENLVSVGLVIGLDYEDPYVSPYQEFQKLKHHPFYSNVLKDGKCIAYGARALNEGGIQAIPKLNFPGGVIIGASAGFMNVPKIKGTHTAMKSAMIAAESCYDEITKLPSFESVLEEKGEENVDISEEPLLNIESYENSLKRSWVYDELYEVRNIRPSFNTKAGLFGGMMYSGIDTLLLKGKAPWTFKFGHSDSSVTKPAKDFQPKNYPKPDGVLSFDILTSVSRTGTFHDDNEECHLRIGKDQDLDKFTDESFPVYKGIEERFCPAGVYEFVKDESSKYGVKFKINSQNCIHCKTCDIKSPNQKINWTVPEGGDGPKYTIT
ncbi:similar to Saccharomyces cerevisiae YOR356W CIR2 Putative ortholog of human electron transfer flavoprotein dehydrogenase (ETF-dH) [Maudiozyma barnettii]|uniref:Electron transfer flavoprotein-ubiquinone oxidoreductase n=1 Tax=Maudiozyma barnettii TaxID=61262 RepID=A0A8H2VFY7_9SACH|nr:putative electron-transferring-flavoprotein dehydrogenase [Kazachstania barnettii]CAB4254840.1 similar to Saccharomyces cerevisiae YOR356W CIR2 Putative ortholog of human electron transfer flavoprotein dehydrogenase (ETF-dH) [Kazachstania barnettii]CAD1783041.1 similar to Saccharomyces cerevisiae YOR356W CIR2 Putative ortholog of human electron transfer flavoprotein dehydrogenase (ETF-dH) [Kazachstania barnettii]